MKLLMVFSLLLVLLVPQHAVSVTAQQGVEGAAREGAVSKQEFDYDVALKVSQAAIGNQLGDYSFIDARGNQLSMNDLRGKPLVLSMVYTSCFQICPMTTRHLSQVVEKARDALGRDSFNVAVVGFDTPVDTPDAMQYFANKQGVHDKDWYLLSIKAKEVEALARDTGFIYFPSVNGFDHLIQATVIDAEGMVYQQVYGQVFDTPLLIEPLKELVLGRPRQGQTFISEVSNKIRLFCTTYDPVRDGYYFDYSLFIGILIGLSIILFTGVHIVKEWRKTGQRPDT